MTSSSVCPVCNFTPCLCRLASGQVQSEASKLNLKPGDIITNEGGRGQIIRAREGKCQMCENLKAAGLLDEDLAKYKIHQLRHGTGRDISVPPTAKASEAKDLDPEIRKMVNENFEKLLWNDDVTGKAKRGTCTDGCHTWGMRGEEVCRCGCLSTAKATSVYNSLNDIHKPDDVGTEYTKAKATHNPVPPDGCSCASFWTIRRTHKPDCSLAKATSEEAAKDTNQES